ncbi:gamma-glutamyltransferase [Lichenibacterium dinghuense]|uniref:gamma-glutamyltransferase n=1 Tax=Lichenibacterium dinghuense TaxID=2895977 RepID=UPI001F32EA0A|nr:gamma-glutamyltransferase [Lichenibacterium sp. 6Y81]
MDDAETYAIAALAAPHPLAGAAARDVLVEGGTVVEAALAAAMVSAVAAPGCAGLGGDALWMIREPGPRGRVRVLDARGTVAAAARLSFYRERGHEAVPRRGAEAALASPGVVAGWIEVHALSTATGGRLPVARLLEPAVAAARHGFAPSPPDAEALAAGGPSLSAVPGFDTAFLVEGRAPAPNERRFAPALAAALAHLAEAGLDDFYTGDVARELAADLDALSCPLGRLDLRRTEARWREPQTLDLGRHALAVPPTRSGLRAAVALGLAGALAAAGFDAAEADGFGRWHGLIESCRAADAVVDDAETRDRDPADLLDGARLARFALKLDRARASRAGAPARAPLDEAASAIVAVGRDGSAVSVVQTLGSAFGSGIVCGRTGVLMGNRGAGLALDPDLGPILRPGRRVPLASLPALVSNARDGRVAAIGALGAAAPAAVAQLADRAMRGAGPGEALAAPRFALGAAPDGREAAVLVKAEREPGPRRPLRAAGHTIVEGESAVWTAGVALRDGAGRVTAAADGGAAEGI